jgi:hypothetical protein
MMMMQIVGGLSGIATKRRHRITFLSVEDCRQGNNEVASFLAWVRAMVSSRSIIPPSGRIHHPLLSVRNYARGHHGRLCVEFVQRDVQPGDAK